MVEIKYHLRRFRLGLLVLLLAGLGLSSLAPVGYMIAPSATGWPAVVVCPETHALARLVASASGDTATIDHAAMGHGQDGDNGSSANQSKDCAFAGALKLATGPIDPDLLAAALAFVLLLGLAPSSAIRVSIRRYLRPPLRAPPVHI